MDNYNVVGDIAGQFLTLEALLAKMPKDSTLLSLGDPNDRGPNSRQVIEFLMKNGKTVNSNHAHLFVEAWKQSAMPGSHPLYYEDQVFFYNGGHATMASYAGTAKNSWGSLGKSIHELVPQSHIDFLEKCPMYIESDNYVFTHAPLATQVTLKEASRLGDGFVGMRPDRISDESLIWNRYVPERPHKDLKGKINVFGHNSSNAIKVFTTEFTNGIKCETQEKFDEIWNKRDKFPVYAICLDTSSVRVLTGLHLPTMTIYQQEYLDDSPPVRGPYGALY